MSQTSSDSSRGWNLTNQWTKVGILWACLLFQQHPGWQRWLDGYGMDGFCQLIASFAQGIDIVDFLLHMCLLHSPSGFRPQDLVFHRSLFGHILEKKWWPGHICWKLWWPGKQHTWFSLGDSSPKFQKWWWTQWSTPEIGDRTHCRQVGHGKSDSVCSTKNVSWAWW